MDFDGEYRTLPSTDSGIRSVLQALRHLRHTQDRKYSEWEQWGTIYANGLGININEWLLLIVMNEIFLRYRELGKAGTHTQKTRKNGKRGERKKERLSPLSSLLIKLSSHKTSFPSDEVVTPSPHLVEIDLRRLARAHAATHVALHHRR